MTMELTVLLSFDNADTVAAQRGATSTDTLAIKRHDFLDLVLQYTATAHKLLSPKRAKGNIAMHCCNAAAIQSQ